MGDVKTGTQESGLSNPAMKAAATTIGNQLNSQLGKGVTPYDQSMVPGLSSQTQAGIGALTNNPNNSVFSGGVTGTLGQQAQIAQGNFGDDPLRQRIMDDVQAQTSSLYNAAGRFGGDTNKEAFTENLVGALAPYDMQRQQQAIGNMGTLYSMSNMPASAQLQAGQTMDQWNAAKAQDDARRFDATQNAGWNTIQRGGSIFAGTAPVSGTTTTESQPWWKVGTGLGATALGFM